MIIGCDSTRFIVSVCDGHSARITFALRNKKSCLNYAYYMPLCMLLCGPKIRNKDLVYSNSKCADHTVRSHCLISAFVVRCVSYVFISSPEPSGSQGELIVYANTPMQYTGIFHGCKNVHFR